MTNKKSLKIGLVCPYNITKGGGVQEGVLAIAAELKSRGHGVKIVTPLPKETNKSDWPDIIFVGSATDIKSPFATTAQISVGFNSDALQEILEQQNFDVLHFHEPWVPVLSRQLLTRSQSINIGTFHARLPDTVMSKTIEAVITPYTKPLLKHLDALTAVSTAAAEYVTTLTDKHIEIIPNGIDSVKYTSIGRGTNNSGAKTVLYIGRLEKRKGVKYLLKAFRLLQATHPDVKLLLIGDGPDKEKLQTYVDQHSIKNVEFLGYVDEQTKLQTLGNADVFCSPALYGESFGIVLLEAMAMGIPIVAGDNPGYTTVMKDRGKLSLVNPKNTDEFSRKLELFLEDAELISLWKTWAKQYVKEFDYTRVVDQYEALYKRLLQK